MNKRQLQQLRQDIVLGSLFYWDYRNSLGIEEHLVCDFFDAFDEYICELYEEKHKTKKYNIWQVYDEFDNIDELWHYYNSIEQDPLPFEDNSLELRHETMKGALA